MDIWREWAVKVLLLRRTRTRTKRWSKGVSFDEDKSERLDEQFLNA